MDPQPSRFPSLRSTTAKIVAGYALTFALLVALIPVCELLSVGQNGNAFFQEVILIGAFVAMASCCAVGGGLVMLAFPSQRTAGAHVFFVGALSLVAVVLGVWAGNRVRMSAFHNLAIRTKPIIAAIGKFEQDHKRPPNSFEELVPTYLPTIPKTGMAAYPDYEYVSGEKAIEDFNENPWALYVPCSSGIMNWDIFLYLPKQNYPESGYGGTLQKVGDWAYVHE